ncbi:MAG: hypothetical protein ABIG20_00355 [archaeon]
MGNDKNITEASLGKNGFICAYIMDTAFQKYGKKRSGRMYITYEQYGQVYDEARGASFFDFSRIVLISSINSLVNLFFIEKKIVENNLRILVKGPSYQTIREDLISRADEYAKYLNKIGWVENDR